MDAPGLNPVTVHADLRSTWSCRRLDFAPTELPAILRWRSYKDFTPTERF